MIYTRDPEYPIASPTASTYSCVARKSDWANSHNPPESPGTLSLVIRAIMCRVPSKDRRGGKWAWVLSPAFWPLIGRESQYVWEHAGVGFKWKRRRESKVLMAKKSLSRSAKRTSLTQCLRGEWPPQGIFRLSYRLKKMVVGAKSKWVPWEASKKMLAWVKGRASLRSCLLACARSLF